MGSLEENRLGIASHGQEDWSGREDLNLRHPAPKGETVWQQEATQCHNIPQKRQYWKGVSCLTVNLYCLVWHRLTAPEFVFFDFSLPLFLSANGASKTWKATGELIPNSSAMSDGFRISLSHESIQEFSVVNVDRKGHIGSPVRNLATQPQPYQHRERSLPS